MNILALIPARGGSKGIPGKNIKPLGGKPLIAYSIEAALGSARGARVVVATDSEAIAEASRRAGAEVPFLRPAELATDRSPSIDTVIHALEFYEGRGMAFDALCLLQPTCPFRRAEAIRGAIEHFAQSGADSLISVREVPHQYNPHWTFEPTEEGPFLKNATGEESIIPRRQELPPAYHRDGSIYITRTEVLRSQRSLYGSRIAYCTSDAADHVNIDTPADWARAESLLNKN